MIIENGVGNGDKLKINGRNEALTFSVIESEAQASNDVGDAYNINTGDISVTTSTSSGVLYFKNDEDYDIVIESVAFGLRDVTGGDGKQKLYIIRNPTGGTLVDATTNVSMNANRNFGSSKTLKSTTLAYKASAQNQTLTGGTDIVMLYVDIGRLYAPINMEVPRGSSIGLRLDCTSIAATFYGALILHVKDGVR
jgi:hypothetical protein